MPFVQISAVTRYGLEHVNVFMSVTPQSNAFSIGLDEENCRIYSAPGGNEKRYITHSSTNNYCVEFGSLEELFNVNNQLLVVGRLENLRLSFTSMTERDEFVAMIETIGYRNEEPEEDLPSV